MKKHLYILGIIGLSALNATAMEKEEIEIVSPDFHTVVMKNNGKNKYTSWTEYNHVNLNDFTIMQTTKFGGDSKPIYLFKHDLRSLSPYFDISSDAPSNRKKISKIFHTSIEYLYKKSPEIKDHPHIVITEKNKDNITQYTCVNLNNATILITNKDKKTSEVSCQYSIGDLPYRYIFAHSPEAKKSTIRDENKIFYKAIARVHEALSNTSNN